MLLRQSWTRYGRGIRPVLAGVVALGVLVGATRAADPVFSGPQPGEKTTGFSVLDLTAGKPGETTRDPVADADGAPTVLVFVHGIERSLVPLLKAVDEYGARQSGRLRTEVVFLAGDRIAGLQRVRAASGSLRLRSRVGLSVDGAEGPGNYGLNRDCLMTVVAARDNGVVTNFALVQPGIADAPAVVAALAALCGDPKPPTADEVLASARPGRAAAAGERMARDDSGRAAEGRGPFPGAVPEDPRLQALLRRFIRPGTDNATVDATLAEVKAYIAGNPELRRQAIDGWVRVLHFGDRYGTPYSREVGAAFLKSLQE